VSRWDYKIPSNGYCTEIFWQKDFPSFQNHGKFLQNVSKVREYGCIFSWTKGQDLSDEYQYTSESWLCNFGEEDCNTALEMSISIMVNIFLSATQGGLQKEKENMKSIFLPGL